MSPPAKDAYVLHRPPPIKIHRVSHDIQKQTSSSSSNSSNSSNSNNSSSSSNSSISSGTTNVSSNNKTVNNTNNNNSNNNQNQDHQQQRHPVIIYTHSPKVIHTHARDFMALVQRLTGMSHEDDDEEGEAPGGHCAEPPPSGQTPEVAGRDGVDRGKPVVVGRDEYPPPVNSCAVGENKEMMHVDVALPHVDHISGVPQLAVAAGPMLASPPFDAMGSAQMSFFPPEIPVFPANTAPSDFFCSPKPFYRYDVFCPQLTFQDY